MSGTLHSQINKEVEFETEEIAQQSPKDNKEQREPRHPPPTLLPQERVANEHGQTIMFVTNYPRLLRDTSFGVLHSS